MSQGIIRNCKGNFRISLPPGAAGATRRRPDAPQILANQYWVWGEVPPPQRQRSAPRRRPSRACLPPSEHGICEICVMWPRMSQRTVAWNASELRGMLESMCAGKVSTLPTLRPPPKRLDWSGVPPERLRSASECFLLPHNNLYSRCLIFASG